jgi:hypothetical protein
VDLGGTSIVCPYKFDVPVEIIWDREREKLGYNNLVAFTMGECILLRV